MSSAIGLAILGVPLPIPMGLFAGLLTFVPNIGPIDGSEGPPRASSPRAP